jgi:aldehyde dehydrogenase (NAD+)
MGMTEIQAFESLVHCREPGGIHIEKRKQILQLIQQWIQSHEHEIQAALTADLAKPQLEAYLSEVYFTLHTLKHTLENIDRWVRPLKISTPFNQWPSQNWIQPTPKGIVLIIGPWNYPFHLCIAPLIDAIGAGNQAVIKPSELSPATSKLLAQMIHVCALNDFIQVVEGGRETTQNLLQLPFDHVFFTGSTSVGKIIAKQAAEQLIPVTLELGGKNPCIVDETADIELSAKRILLSKFFNSGQTCLAPDFVWIDQKVSAQFIETCKSQLKQFYPTESEWKKDTARIPNSSHFERLKNLISSKDWSLYSYEASSLRISPTLVVSPSWDHPLMQDEIFGPILPIVEFNSIEDIKPKLKRWTPLALYIFSRDKNFQDELVRNSRSGGVCINDCMKQFTNIQMPFGGFGNSGYGAYHGKAGFDTFTHHRAISRRSFWWDKFSAYPPYDKIFKMIRKFVR